MKKITSTYYTGVDSYYITVNNEISDHMSIHEYGEPLTGIMRHWGERKKLISELKQIIKILEDFKE